MPRPSKGARLWLQPARRSRNGNIEEHSVWVIRDGSRKRSTGFREEERGEAERALADYLAEKHDPSHHRNNRADLIPIADAIAAYSEEIAPAHARPTETAARLQNLLDHFGEQCMADVNGSACRAYVSARGVESSARRELEDLRAAFHHFFREGHVDRLIPVVLPPKPSSRERWLERSEAARLIWAAWRLRQKYKGHPTERAIAKHVARFILVALYTGTRAGAVCGAAIRPTIGCGYIDLGAGLFHRRPPGERETKKRQPPVALPDRLLAHLRRWERLGISGTHVVEWNGKPVTKINKAFRAVRAAAGFEEDVVPHTLRHTAATWLARAGVPFVEGADYVGMSVETFERVYRHHAPGFQEQARNKIASKPPRQKPDRNPRTSEEHGRRSG
ncbi:Site-specific recombinase XerD [Stappia sp. ES.058]|nr:Site-specific recombinase XerD [Stappia sp. ES.058]